MSGKWFVQGTDTELIGVKVTVEGVYHLAGMDKTGAPIFGPKLEMDEDSVEFTLNKDGLVFVTEEHDSYQAPSVVYRDDNGQETIYNGAPSGYDRHITESICEVWRKEVASRKTMSGLSEWVGDLQDDKWLALHGLYLRKRDGLIAQAHRGAWQVTEHYEPGMVTDGLDDGGFFVAVGDDREDLIRAGLERIQKTINMAVVRS